MNEGKKSEDTCCSIKTVTRTKLTEPSHKNDQTVERVDGISFDQIYSWPVEEDLFWYPFGPPRIVDHRRGNDHRTAMFWP